MFRDFNKVKLEPVSHRYFHQDGREFKSNSFVRRQFVEPFNEKIAFYSAKKKLKELGNANPTAEELRFAEKEVLAGWKMTNVASTDRGTHIHNCLETYDKTTKIIDVALEPMVRNIANLFVRYDKTYVEQCVYSEYYEVAATADKICLRAPAKFQSKKDAVIDIYDYKTNVSKGIQYNSPYGKWFKEPLEHLEDANYNDYALQLSIEGLFIEEMLGRKIGSLNIIYIPPGNEANFKVIPIPYMKYDAIAMLDWYISKIANSINHEAQEVVSDYQDFDSMI